MRRRVDDIYPKRMAWRRQGIHWLPAPVGPFAMHMRLYWPREDALEGKRSHLRSDGSGPRLYKARIRHARAAPLRASGRRRTVSQHYARRLKTATNMASSSRRGPDCWSHGAAIAQEVQEGSTMARAKQASKRKRPKIALPVWGAAGMSLAMAGGASAATAPTAKAPSQGKILPPVMALGEEELSDISLATFYVFDKENRTPLLGERYARRCGGGCGRCGGAGRCGGRCGGGCAVARCGGRCGGCAVVRRCGVGCAVACSCSCCLSYSWSYCQPC
jgi:hypothetical protein